MDIVKDFLEASTVHGVQYIATSNSKTIKLFWFLAVSAAFITASNLIYDAYSSWEQSPISTSISINPISELEFPKVTICPPERSYTALNHDLITAKRTNFTSKDREELKNASRRIFLHDPYLKMAEQKLKELKHTNIWDIYKGFQSPPVPSPPYTLKTKFTLSEGEVATPGWGEVWDEEIYIRRHYHHYEIKFPSISKTANFVIRISTVTGMSPCGRRR